MPQLKLFCQSFLQMHLEPFFRPLESALERLAHFGLGHVGPAPEPVRRPLVVVPHFDGHFQIGEDREDGRFVAVEREIFCETHKHERQTRPGSTRHKRSRSWRFRDPERE